MSAPPRFVSPKLYTGTRGDEAADFIEAVGRVTKDSYGGRSGDLIRLRSWQRNLLRRLLATDDGLLAYRKALVLLPRKNGKSALGAGLALWSLVMGVEGGEIYSVAGDRDQARLVFGTARRMVEMDAELSGLLTCFRDCIEFTATGSTYRVKSAEAGLSEGLNPTFVVFDELHVQKSRDLWDVMSLGSAGRPESMLLGITTAGVKADRFGQPTICKSLRDYGVSVASGEIDDPTFFFAEWSSDDQDDWRDPATWAKANPGLGDLLSVEALEADCRTTPEANFANKHLNRWTAAENAWLPSGVWDGLVDRSEVTVGTPCVFGFDGSQSHDATALVMVTVERTPCVRVLELWERPPDDVHWRVEYAEVERAVRRAAEKWHPREIVADPFLWRATLEAMADDGLPVVEFPQTATYMVPATQGFYEAVIDGRISHDGDSRLARHLQNARIKITETGERLSKAGNNSDQKIDLAVASVMAFDRATRLFGQAEEDAGVGAISLTEKARTMAPERRDEAIARRQALVERALARAGR